MSRNLEARTPVNELYAARTGPNDRARETAARGIRLSILMVFLLGFAVFITVESAFFIRGDKQWPVMLAELGAFVLASVILAIYAYHLVMLTWKAAYKADETLHSITDISSDAVFSIDATAMITSWSKGAERIFGFTAEEAVDESLALILPDDFLERDIDVLEPLLATGLVVRHRTMGKRKGGEPLPVEASLTLLKGDNGEPSGLLAVLRDIGEQVWMENELRRSRDELETRVEARTEALRKVNAELEGFSHTLSHDLKGPLAHLTMAAWYLKAMRNGEIPDDPSVCDEMLQTIEEGTSQCNELIDGMLRLAEAGQEPVEAGPVDVRTIVERVVGERSAQIASAGIEVRILNDLGDVVAEATHIYQLFANLIGNAIKHCPDSNGIITIERFEQVEGIHYFKVRDNGEGIPEQNLQKIFDPFFKGCGGGFGIGLATVNKIVQVYRGYIEAFNDGGACFEFAIRDFDAVRPRSLTR